MPKRPDNKGLEIVKRRWRTKRQIEEAGEPGIRSKKESLENQAPELVTKSWSTRARGSKKGWKGEEVVEEK